MWLGEKKLFLNNGFPEKPNKNKIRNAFPEAVFSYVVSNVELLRLRLHMLFFMLNRCCLVEIKEYRTVGIHAKLASFLSHVLPLGCLRWVGWGAVQ